LTHALDLLYNFDPRKLEFKGRVARYPLTILAMRWLPFHAVTFKIPL